MYAVEMRKITKRFGSFTANDQIDFLVKKGEIHCLLGENGAGKTTLMNVLFGLYKADEGELKINGKEIKKTFCKKCFSMWIRNGSSAFHVSGCTYSMGKCCDRK